METWYNLNLGDGMFGALPATEIEAAFERSAKEDNCPPQMAVFTRLESEGRLHCEMIAYFSPAAQALAGDFQAQPCPKPKRQGLTLLAGSSTVWTQLFPNEL